jgi:ubiquinone/menaquinone biosynthesis C-methylase UbiE
VPTPDFTGERVVPGVTPHETYREHLGRYEFAGGYVAGKRVLDIACGTGYGSSSLRRAGAESVVGADRSGEALRYARSRYGRRGNGFARLDATAMPFLSESFDVVVSFETIEHLPDREGFLRECHRVLRAGGVFVCSSPNKRVYSPGRTHPVNPHHVLEFTARQFRQLLSAHFDDVELCAQRTMGLRRRLVYEFGNLEACIPAAGTLVRWLFARDSSEEITAQPEEAPDSPTPAEYRVEPFRSTLRRPATFFVAICRGRAR